jgi:hypothetical protein
MNPIDRDGKGIRRGEPGEVMVSKQMALGATIAVVVVAAAFYFWPADENGRNTSTDTSTRVERTPTKPPSAPSTPTSPNQ